MTPSLSDANGRWSSTNTLGCNLSELGISYELIVLGSTRDDFIATSASSRATVIDQASYGADGAFRGVCLETAGTYDGRVTAPGSQPHV